jgi:hypothetical protein
MKKQLKRYANLIPIILGFAMVGVMMSIGITLIMYG